VAAALPPHFADMQAWPESADGVARAFEPIWSSGFRR
jgi:hypothetical protein